jgi:hypothetical protein
LCGGPGLCARTEIAAPVREFGALLPIHATENATENAADVRDTVVDGREPMRDRGLGTLDEGAVLTDLEILALS